MPNRPTDSSEKCYFWPKGLKQSIQRADVATSFLTSLTRRCISLSAPYRLRQVTVILRMVISVNYVFNFGAVALNVEKTVVRSKGISQKNVSVGGFVLGAVHILHAWRDWNACTHVRRFNVVSFSNNRLQPGIFLYLINIFSSKSIPIMSLLGLY